MYVKKRRSHEKFVRLMLMKLTTEGDDLAKFRYALLHANISKMTEADKRKMLGVIEKLSKEIEEGKRLDFQLAFYLDS